MKDEATEELGVWLLGERAGTLWLEDARLRFRYDTDWLKQSGVMALSQSLPLQVEAFDDQVCRPFFAGLLPEGDLRRRIAQQCQLSQANDFGLLAAIGGDCAGAVSLAPRDQAPGPAEVEWLTPTQLITLLAELPRRPMLAQRDGLRLSLAGAQNKLPVVVEGQRIGLPKGSAASTHILKPAIAAVDNSVTNEAFCMALARMMKLRAAETQIVMAGDQRILLVRRYDRRRADDGGWSRLHQEDFCQALAVPPDLKYQNEGGPDLQACFSLLRQATRPSAPEVIRLLDAVIFNALIGHHDAHAKNFSILYQTQAATLAPLYDLLCTAVYPTLTDKMAMKVGSKYRFAEVQARHWEQFAKAAGLSEAQAKKRVAGIAKQLPACARRLQTEALYSDQPLVERIVSLIEQRCAITLERLNT